MAKYKKPKKKSMAVTIRQEINILDAILSAASGVSATSNEIVLLDSTQFTNPTYYFEVVADSTISISFNVTLRRSGTTTDDATCNVPLLTTSYTRIRSSSFVPPTGKTSYVVFIDDTVGATKNVKSARIIIIDNPDVLTNTQTQVEVGNNETGKTNTTDAALTNPKYWKYTAANYDGNPLFYAEVVYKRSSNMDTTTIKLQEDDGSFGSWADKVTIVSAGTATAATRIRSAAFTPTDGRNYRLVSVSSSNMSTYDIYRAGVVIYQSDGAFNSTGGGSGIVQGGTAGAGETNQKRAQGFKLNSNSTITAVKLKLAKTAAPTDNLNVDITSSLGGSSLANASIAGGSLTTSSTLTTLTFGTPVSLNGATDYFLEFSRSGVRDTTNYFNVEDSASLSSDYPWGTERVRNSTVWSSDISEDTYFQLVGQLGITKLESQYLLLNTADGGTGLQTYQTLFDADEWSGVTNAYYHAHDATNAADSTKLTRESSTPGTFDTDITNSTVTGANQQISAALTLTDDKQIDSNVVTSTGVVGASRILVAVSVNAVTSTYPGFYSGGVGWF